MRLHYCGKYNGDEASLPCGEHKPEAVQFKEPEDSKKLGLVANGIALVLFIIIIPVFVLRSGIDGYNFFAGLIALLAAFPHEILHGICFRGDVYLYTNLKQGMLFVVGPEDMSKAHFVFMSMLPNLVFGFIPFILFLIHPEWSFLGCVGGFSIPMGAGDYLNVFNALTQMPKGARTYMHGFHSYWYIP